ncbi:MAG: class I SAM-dependent methyltransferase [Thermodesulfobacteriota bacterium]
MRALAVEERVQAHKGLVIDSHEGYSIVDCSSCGFVHIDPLPDERDMERVYMDEYFTEEKPTFIKSVLEDLEWWNINYDERLDFMESRLGRERRILDIGCGPGFFLQRAARRGWQCLGVEPSKLAAEHAAGLGLAVKNEFFEGNELKKQGYVFDSIHASEVLEHVADPLGILQESHSLLVQGGIICAVVPNDYSPVQKVLRDSLGYSPYWLAPPHHINYFTFDSMKALMRKAGFTIAGVSATFPMDFFLLMGENYVDDQSLGRRSHGLRKNLDTMLSTPPLMAFKKDMYALMARHGIGREMIIYGIKGERWPEQL